MTQHTIYVESSRFTPVLSGQKSYLVIPPGVGVRIGDYVRAVEYTNSAPTGYELGALVTWVDENIAGAIIALRTVTTVHPNGLGPEIHFTSKGGYSA